MAERSSSQASLLWTYIRAISQFQRKDSGNSGTGSLTRSRNRKKWSYTDSFIDKYTTRNFGEISTESDCDFSESETDGTTYEQDDDERPSWAYVVKPDGRFLQYWLFFVTLAVIYYGWFLVARETWLETKEDELARLWNSIDGICDTIFLLDIVVQLRTGYLEHGLLVTNGKKLVNRYVRTVYFACDTLWILPLRFIVYKITKMDRPLLKSLRFLKAYRARQFFLKVEYAASHPNGVRLFNLIHFLFLLTHWFGAVYYFVSRTVEEFGQGEWVLPNSTEYNKTARQYLASFYWSTITLTTIGDIPRPESNVEYVVQILGYMLGVFVFATIVGQVGAVVENRNSLRLAFERHVDNAKRYMREHKVPREVQKPILRWYEYAWTRGQMTGRGDVNCLGLLPTKLRTELALHVNLKTLKKVSFFKRCHPEFLHDLVLKMQLNVITPGDLLCRKGEVPREVFIVSDGLLEVIGKRGRVLRKLEKGDFFGEIGAMVSESGSNRRQVDVRSVGYSELFTISKEDIIRLLKDHPQAKKVLEDVAKCYNFNKSKRRRKPTKVPTERQNGATFREEDETNLAKNHSQGSSSQVEGITLQVPGPRDHSPTVKLKAAQSFNLKRIKKANRNSLRLIPEGTTKKRKSQLRRLSGEDQDEGVKDVYRPSQISGKGAANKGKGRVAIPDDITSIVENKMGQVSDDVKKLLAYARELEEKVNTVKNEKTKLEEELTELKASRKVQTKQKVEGETDL